MDRIKLNKKEKEILFALKDAGYKDSFKPDYENDIIVLLEDGLITATKTLGQYVAIKLTQKGKAYLHCNPKLKNPSIFDDKKYVISTSIAILALILSIVK